MPCLLPGLCVCLLLTHGPVWGARPAGPATAASSADALPEPPQVGASGEIVAPPADLSRLPEIEDLPQEPDPTQERAQPPAMPYLQQMLEDPDPEFVPAGPNTSVDPRAAWEGIMAAPPPSPQEQRARTLRGIGISLVVLGSLGLLVAAAGLPSSQDNPILRGLDYAALGVSGLSLAAGIPVLVVGEVRLRALRRAAAGLSLRLSPPTTWGAAGTGFSLSFGSRF